jgi:hypothetical protein
MIEGLERYGIYAVLGGVLLLAAGWIWLLARAFRKKLRGRLAAVFPPFAPLVALGNHRQAAGPLALMAAGGLLLAAPYVVNLVSPYLIDLGPRETLVDGQRHLTLTGWDRSDYDRVLRARTDVRVLQLANPDVDDDDVRALAMLQGLHEVDLNGTRITDATLALLAALPELQIARLRATAITDEGFRRHLENHPQLRELDLRETAVKSSTVRAWRSAKEGRKALR